MAKPGVRIRMTTMTAREIKKELVDRAIKLVHRTCKGKDCPSWESAHLLKAGLRIGKKRAHLDLECPYLGDGNPSHLQNLAVELELFPMRKSLGMQQTKAIVRIANEVKAFSERNAMQVIAEASH